MDPFEWMDSARLRPIPNVARCELPSPPTSSSSLESSRTVVAFDCLGGYYKVLLGCAVSVSRFLLSYFVATSGSRWVTPSLLDFRGISSDCDFSSVITGTLSSFFAGEGLIFAFWYSVFEIYLSFASSCPGGGGCFGIQVVFTRILLVYCPSLSMAIHWSTPLLMQSVDSSMLAAPTKLFVSTSSSHITSFISSPM